MSDNKEKNNVVTEDLSGKDRVVKNVIMSWGSHLVLIVIGFIMPRLINDHLGQISLGIWDLSWSFVNYLSLTNFGVGSSVNRYVAKYRSLKDYVALNQSISSVIFIQFVIALIVTIGTFILVWFMPVFVGDHEGVDIYQVRWVVALFGLSLAVQMIFDTSRGVLTGIHRWDVYNILNALSHIINAVLMVVVMLAGGDLIALAVTYFIVNLITESYRSVMAKRLCVELDIKKKYVNFPDIRKMFKFGVKTFISTAPGILVVQTINIMTASILGPGALAVFARPFALVRHVETFVNKYSFVLTPMVGSISTQENKDELRAFLIDSTKYSVTFSLPILLFIGVLGDHLLQIWMGGKYARLDIILILSLGFFLPIAQGPALRVLIGMNKHGNVAIFNLALSMIMLLTGVLYLNYIGWGLVYVALMMSSIFTVTMGMIVPIYTCKAVGVGLFQYIKGAFTMPVFCGIAHLGWLLFCRQFDGYSSLIILIVAAIGSALIVPIFYWFFILPVTYKENIKNKLMKSTK